MRSNDRSKPGIECVVAQHTAPANDNGKADGIGENPEPEPDPDRPTTPEVPRALAGARR